MSPASDSHTPSLGPFRDAAELPLLRLVPPPVRARRVARVLFVAFTLALAFGLLAPWQQSATGTGRVIAYAPLERQQTIEASVEGRVVAWHVQEGDRVEEGQLLVELADNDPRLFERLESERAITAERVATYGLRVRALEERLSAVRAAQEGSTRGACTP